VKIDDLEKVQALVQRLRDLGSTLGSMTLPNDLDNCPVIVRVGDDYTFNNFAFELPDGQFRNDVLAHVIKARTDAIRAQRDLIIAELAALDVDIEDG
jgi:hypothetical protein